jgi:hypothetical protein
MSKFGTKTHRERRFVDLRRVFAFPGCSICTQRAICRASIGRGKIGATLGRLRTHTQAIIQRSPYPVLSL